MSPFRNHPTFTLAVLHRAQEAARNKLICPEKLQIHRSPVFSFSVPQLPAQRSIQICTKDTQQRMNRAERNLIAPLSIRNSNTHIIPVFKIIVHIVQNIFKIREETPGSVKGRWFKAGKWGNQSWNG